MSTNKWVYRKADGQFCFGEGPSSRLYLTDQVNYELADLTDAVPLPDVRMQKWNGSAVVARTVAEITSYDASVKMAAYTATSRQKDVLATCAQIVRARGISAWNAMTIQQKKDATLAEADVWVNIRQFIEDNL